MAVNKDTRLAAHMHLVVIPSIDIDRYRFELIFEEQNENELLLLSNRLDIDMNNVHLIFFEF